MTDSHFRDHTVLIPSPSFHIDLAALDALHPIHYSRRLLIFRCESPAQRDAQLAILKTGLQALVSKCPFLGGIIIPAPDEPATNNKQGWCAIKPGPGLELVVKDARTAMPSFEQLEAANFRFLDLPYNILVPVPQDVPADNPFAACKIQFSAINGGTVLAWAMSHSVADGSGNNELFRILAEEMKLAQDSTPDGLAKAATSATATGDDGTSTHLGFDRSILRNMKSEFSFNIDDHPAYTLKPTTTVTTSANNPPPQASAQPHPFEATGPEIPIVFRLSPTKLAQLKADATLPNAAPISTHDALAALIWRSTMLIRSRRRASSNSNSTVSPSTATAASFFFMPTDARRHLHLPPSYIGNAVYQLTATLDLATLLSPLPQGLQHAASAIRSAITATATHPALVAAYMAKLNETWLDWGFMENYATTGVGMGSDWTSGGLYELDWGREFGRLVRFRYPDEACACVLPRLAGGEAEIVVSVMEGEAEAEVLRDEECLGLYAEK